MACSQAIFPSLVDDYVLNLGKLGIFNGIEVLTLSLLSNVEAL